MDNSAMSYDEILSIVANELTNSKFADTETVSTQLEEALAYYLGAPNGKEVVGRSSVTSTDVADAVEWIMPQIMEAFTGQSDIVEFVPNGKADVLQSQLETEYVYDVLMTHNNGFIILYTLVKDALLQRNGVAKVFVEEDTNYQTESYSGLSQEQLQAISQDPTRVVKEVYEDDDGSFIAKIASAFKEKCVRVQNVPLERFRVNANHNSLDLSDARFTAHIEQKTPSDLATMGFDEDTLSQLSSYSSYRDEYRFRLQGEESNSVIPMPSDESLVPIEVAECYMHIDIDQDGIAELMKITVASDGDTPTVMLSVEEVDCMPWVSTTGILMGHKFQGLSIYDRLKEIQDQKTALLRNLLDNIYLQNNQRTIAVENQVNLDDLMVSRPGGIVRAKRLDAVAPLVTPQVPPEAFSMLDYLDRVRAGRSGVDADGNASPKSMGDNVGSEGVDRLLNAKEALVGLIVRTMAETGIKPLCCKIRDLLHNHVDTIRDFEFRGQWVQVNPADWVTKRRTRVKVGSGTGDRGNKLAALQNVMEVQKEMLASGQPLTSPDRVFTALDDYCKLSGLLSASKYFVDPMSDEGKDMAEKAQAAQAEQGQKDMAGQILQLKAEQQFANAEQIKAQSMVENARIKAQEVTSRGQLERARLQNDQLRYQFEQVKALQDSIDKGDRLALDKLKVLLDGALRLTELEAKTATEQNANFESNKQSVN